MQIQSDAKRNLIFSKLRNICETAVGWSHQ